MTQATEPQFASGSLIRHLSVRKDNAAARFWDSQMRAVVFTEKRQALKAWLMEHAGQTIDTLQATVNPGSGDVRSVWEPGRRVVVGVKPTYAGFADPEGGTVSLRHFKGLVSIAHNADVWLGYDPQFRTVIIYTTAQRPTLGQTEKES